MRPARALALLLLACLSSVTPLAYASPPDPTWTVGLYADADGDDIVVSLTGAAWVVELTPPASLIPLFVALPFAPPDRPHLVCSDIRPTPPSPPSVLSSRFAASAASPSRGGLALARRDSGASVRDKSVRPALEDRSA